MFKDKILIGLIINATLPIIGYGLAVYFGLWINSSFVYLKLLVLILSLFLLPSKAYISKKLKPLYYFFICLFLSAIFSLDPYHSLTRLIAICLPLLYVAGTINYLLDKFNTNQLIINLLICLKYIYIIPLLSLLITGDTILKNDYFYGETIGAFVSNHYGWAGMIFILSHLSVIRAKNEKIISFSSLIALIYFVLIIYSGSRSALVGLSIGIVIWVVKSRKLVLPKILIFIIGAITVVNIYNKNENLNQRVEFTLEQNKVLQNYNLSRFKSGSISLVNKRATAIQLWQFALINNPTLIYFGFGVDQFKEGINKYFPRINKEYYESGIHNSYAEILTNSGIFSFAFFIYYFTILPLIIYWRTYNSRILPFIGVVIILPLFESNLSGGQFNFILGLFLSF